MDYFDQMDVKSNVTKFLLPEHGGPCGNQSTDHNNSIYMQKDTVSENSAGADDILYNETVMRGAFAQFLRRLADQVESGLISLFDAISMSPCQASVSMPSQQKNLNTSTNFASTASTSSPINNNSNNNNNSINLTHIDSSPSSSPRPLHIHQSCVPGKQSPPSPQSNQQQILEEETLHEVGSQSLGHYSASALAGVSEDTNELRHIQQMNQEGGSSQVFSSDVTQDQGLDIKVVPLMSAYLNSSLDPYVDVLVDSIRLQALIQRVEAIDDPTSPEDMHRLSLSILREAINLTFTKIELANASGLGLRRTRTDSGYPLDRRKVEAIKFFYTNLCVRRQWPKVSKSTFHKAFTIKISNAKRDLRRL